ncbi:MAG: alkaline shock response membrane anchor protein AmaP [Candidatus Omnitrophota bacterium]|jgi:uncharacterized alkaline shock family protein YloU|nr:MAG: alkaline shock response membrane anchor protein AmaP [Candidatus Omnitrophota bacterium]
MKQFTLGLSFILLFCLSFTCGIIGIWDPSLLLVLGALMERIHGEYWGRILVVAVGFITLGCSLSLFALLIGLEPRARRQVVLENENGKVGVALDAVEDFIKRKCSAIPGIRDLQIRAEEVDGELLVRTKVVLELQRSVPDFTREFQGKIHRELEETLGLKNIKEVEVHIHKLFPRESSKEPVLLSPPPQSQVYLKDTENEDALSDENTLDGDAIASQDENGDDIITVITESEDTKEEQR